MKNTLYFIRLFSNNAINNAVDNKRLMLISDYVIYDNKFIKNRTGRTNEFICNSDIALLVQSFDGVVISKSIKHDDELISKKFITSSVNKYLKIQTEVIDPIIDSVGLELRGLYPSMNKKQSIDWALEFVNTDDCDDVFERLDNLFTRNGMQSKNINDEFEKFLKTS